MDGHHFLLIMLANKMVTAARQRVIRDLPGQPPPAAGGRERLSERALARMWNGCADPRPFRAAWWHDNFV
jgi:hypothetical protein